MEITEEKTQKHLPDNTAFKQQRLPAWAPILSAKSTLPIFFIVSIAFVPIGVVLLVTSEAVVEFQYDYTDCMSAENPGIRCSLLRINQSSMTQPCTCVINITLGTSMDGNVYAYYGLTNFFQNHRRYVKSRDDNQLFGVHVATTSVSTSCAPYNLFNDNGTIRPIAPCGAIANSMFNDTFTFSQGSAQVPIVRTGIAWPTDYSVKFNNPFPSNDLDQAFSQYAKPSNWQKPVQSLDRNLSTNNGYKNEAFIVWMRTAAFSHFRKPYGILNRVAGYTNGLPSGQYTLLVDYNFPVTAFGGRKRFILSTTSWMGGKNSFLGVAYIVFGAMCFIGGILLTMIHLHARNTREVNFK